MSKPNPRWELEFKQVKGRKKQQANKQCKKKKGTAGSLKGFIGTY